MLAITKNSYAISLLLRVKNSISFDIGVIGNYYYSYTSTHKALRWNIRPDCYSDNRFPGIHSTKACISTKFLVDTITSENTKRGF